MQLFFSVIPFFLPAFAVGFVALGFLWRWWLLVPAAMAAAYFGKAQYDGVMAADSPGVLLAVGLIVFLLIGAGSGTVASALVISGRILRLRLLVPMFVLPVIFILGCLSYFAVSWAQKELREARYRSPSESCLTDLHPARLGSVQLDIPVAPGLFLWGVNGRDDHYILWSNPEARAFCSKASVGAVPLSGVTFMIDGTPSRRKEDTQRPFCNSSHSEYPWAEMACNLISTEIIPNSSVRVEVSVPRDDTDWLAKEREAMMRNPMSVRSDGVTVYHGQYDIHLERADGFFAKCSSYNTPIQPWLYCSARATLPAGLSLKYSFRTTEDIFLQQSVKVTASAHAMFDSLRHNK